MSDSKSLLPAPELPQPPTTSKWEREYRAFRRLLPKLLQTHREQFVVVHEEQVVDSGSDELALAMRFYEKYGNVSMHLGLVSEQPERVVRIPHFRELPRTGEGS